MSHMVSSVTKQVETAVRTDYCRSQWGTPVSHISGKIKLIFIHSRMKWLYFCSCNQDYKQTKSKEKKKSLVGSSQFPPAFSYSVADTGGPLGKILSFPLSFDI